MKNLNATATATAPAKQWYKSKVIWFNALAAILLVVSGALPMVQGMIPVDIYALVVGAVNIALRFVTQSELKT